jgi:Uma2 family endonuclease
MSTLARHKQVTYDEFSYLVKDGQKADLIDGVIYMSSPDNTDANELNQWLVRLLADFADERDLGKVYASRVACRLEETQAPEPDLLFVRTERLGIVGRGGIDGAPDLVMEIVSPDSIDRDYTKKRKQYQDAGIPEYWIVDEVEEKVVLLRLDARGRYREVKPRKGVLTSEVVPGFWLRPEWLWQKPLPKKKDVLAQLLGG